MLPQPSPKTGDHAARAVTVPLLPYPIALPSPQLLELSLPLALARGAFERRVRAPPTGPRQPAVSTALAIQAAPGMDEFRHQALFSFLRLGE